MVYFVFCMLVFTRTIKFVNWKHTNSTTQQFILKALFGAETWGGARGRRDVYSNSMQLELCYVK